MWDPTTGQKVHTFRAAYKMEMFFPLLLQISTTWQLSAFSFSHEMKWNHGLMQPMQFASGLVVVEPKALSRLTGIQPLQVKVACVSTASLFLLGFVCMIVFNIAGMEEQRLREIETHPEFRAEVKQGATGLTRVPMGPQHVKKSRSMTRLRVCVGLIRVGTTVLMVPCVKSIVRLFECHTDADHDPPYFLVSFPWIPCYEGTHLYIAPFAVLLLLSFVLFVIPYGVVKGDADFVAHSDLLKVGQWKQNSVQMAALVYLGIMHVNSKNYFSGMVVEILAKILVPSAHFMLESPFNEATCITIVHLAIVIHSVCMPMYVAQSSNILFTGVKIIGLWISGASLGSLIVDNPWSKKPALLCYAGGAIITGIAVTLYSCKRQHESNLERETEETSMKPRMLAASTRREYMAPRENSWKS
eukprot:gnl/TRDRNA2_/TRDRNA2_156370_c1_seq1.p1 gnl/TRDRNA2_/TRDRNA2_156370_c1~~gnl/TRDRNA2_/TRDRNA2_156370_c1_seq1.p1  ORF type:complete len:475 (-),score=29.29 gnl/TRDRNA2_/TRDRNA2_156370_c1_seq1:34-1275(-)